MNDCEISNDNQIDKNITFIPSKIISNNSGIKLDQ